MTNKTALYLLLMLVLISSASAFWDVKRYFQTQIFVKNNATVNLTYFSINDTQTGRGYNQSLNTTDSVNFWNITAKLLFGNGSFLTNLFSGSGWFNSSTTTHTDLNVNVTNNITTHSNLCIGSDCIDAWSDLNGTGGPAGTAVNQPMTMFVTHSLKHSALLNVSYAEDKNYTFFVIDNAKLFPIGGAFI